MTPPWHPIALHFAARTFDYLCRCRSSWNVLPVPSHLRQKCLHVFIVFVLFDLVFDGLCSGSLLLSEKMNPKNGSTA